MTKAKKSLGQNFLIDDKILELISNFTKIENKFVLEVGPGTGNLTSLLIKKKPKEFYVVEKDDFLSNELNKKYKNKIRVINNDILSINENTLFKNKAIVFGNLPYNISTEILSKWIVNLKEDAWFENLLLMFQKEVADRIIAKANSSDYGRLSILTNWKLNVKKICEVKPESFSPKPKVNSSLLFFTPKKKYFPIKNPGNLEKITRIFFNHRRKMLKKPFNQIFNGNKKILEKLKINLNLRPQNLDFETYYQLTSEFENLRD